MRKFFQKLSAVVAESNSLDMLIRAFLVAGALIGLFFILGLTGCANPGGGGGAVVMQEQEKKIDGPGLAAADALCNKVTSSVPRAYKNGGKTIPYVASTNTFGTEENITTLYSQKCGVEAKGGEEVPPEGGSIGP